MLAKVLQWVVELPDPSMLFLTSVLVTAVVSGLLPSIVASIAGLLVYDFFFVEPIYSLAVAKPQDVVSLVVYLIVGIITARLTARIRDQGEEARQREARTNALYGFSRAIAGAVGLDDLVPVVVRHVGELFASDAILLTADGDHLIAHDGQLAPGGLGDTELASAIRAWRTGEATGPGTDTLPGGERVFVPLATARGIVGVLGLRASRARALSPDQHDLLQAVARQAAVALERCRIDVVLEEQSKTEQIVDASEDGIIVVDPSGVVMHVNEVACAILEIDRTDALGKRFDALEAGHAHYLRLRAGVREVLERPSADRERLEISVFLRGRDHHYVLRQTPFHTRDGSPGGIILALQDVSYVRDQERRREDLLATLSHELGTPLTSMGIAVEMLKRRADKLDSEMRALVDVTHEDVQRLGDVSQRFLDLARSRAMPIAVERKPVDLSAVIVRVVKLFSIHATEKGVHLATDGERPGTIPGDETKLTWALSNLVANAIRHTPVGGHVRLTAGSNDTAVLVSVRDTGPGIPVEQQERIFDRFAQGKGDVGAAGLGLAIVRDVVQAHGGRIHLESAPGEGACFTLELPT